MPRPMDFVTKRRVEVCKKKMHASAVSPCLCLFPFNSLSPSSLLLSVWSLSLSVSLSVSLSLSSSPSTSDGMRDERRGAEHQLGHTPERSDSIPRAPGRKQRCITTGKGGRVDASEGRRDSFGRLTLRTVPDTAKTCRDRGDQSPSPECKHRWDEDEF